MSAYERSEIIGSGRVAKRLGSVLSDLKSGRLNRVVISRNNVLEAVILPVEDYEALEKAATIYEHMSIARIISQRSKEDAAISLDEMLKTEGINPDEL